MFILLVSRVFPLFFIIVNVVFKQLLNLIISQNASHTTLGFFGDSGTTTLIMTLIIGPGTWSLYRGWQETKLHSSKTHRWDVVAFIFQLLLFVTFALHFIVMAFGIGPSGWKIRDIANTIIAISTFFLYTRVLTHYTNLWQADKSWFELQGGSIDGECYIFKAWARVLRDIEENEQKKKKSMSGHDLMAMKMDTSRSRRIRFQGQIVL